MKVLNFNGQDYQIKSSWNELNKVELLEICRMMLLPLDERYKRFLVLGLFTGISFKTMQQFKPEALAEVLQTVDYLFQESTLTINHLPIIDWMKGPEPALTNFTFEQFFGYSEPYYFLYSQNDETALDKLIDVLYNFKGPELNFEKVKAIEPVKKLAILYFYAGCSNFIKRKFKSIFQSAESNKKPDGLEFSRLVNQLNAGDISKNEQIKNTNLYETLIYLQDIIVKNGSK